MKMIKNLIFLGHLPSANSPLRPLPYGILKSIKPGGEKNIMSILLQLFTAGLILILMVFLIIMLLSMVKRKTSFQKLNRFTVLAVVLTFMGLLSLNYSLFQSLLGSLLVLFLIRISYVIYVDSE